jgi:hypothetical protein
MVTEAPSTIRLRLARFERPFAKASAVPHDKR